MSSDTFPHQRVWLILNWCTSKWSACSDRTMCACKFLFCFFYLFTCDWFITGQFESNQISKYQRNHHFNSTHSPTPGDYITHNATWLLIVWSEFRAMLTVASWDEEWATEVFYNVPSVWRWVVLPPEGPALHPLICPESQPVLLWSGTVHWSKVDLSWSCLSAWQQQRYTVTSICWFLEFPFNVYRGEHQDRWGNQYGTHCSAYRGGTGIQTSVFPSEAQFCNTGCCISTVSACRKPERWQQHIVAGGFKRN